MVENLTIDPINYYYFGITVVVLLIYYYCMKSRHQLPHWKKITKNTNMSQNQCDTILVTTKNGKFHMDPNKIEIHMKMLKRALVGLHDSDSVNNCHKCDRYLRTIKNITSEYIKDNTTESSGGELESRVLLANDHIVQERELLQKKLLNSAEHELSCDNLSKQRNYTLLNIILDIDTIIFMIKSSLCKRSSLQVDNMTKLVRELHKSIDVDLVDDQSKYYKNIKPIDDIIDLSDTFDYTKRGKHNKQLHQNTSFRQLDGDQVMNDTPAVNYENPLLTNHLKQTDINPHMEIDNKLLVSHETPKEFIDNISQRGLNFSKKPCMLNRNGFQKTFKNNKHIDRSGRTSLM
jgi:hypothetical protein